MEEQKKPKAKEVNADKESLAALREGEKLVGKCFVCVCCVVVFFNIYFMILLCLYCFP